MPNTSNNDIENLSITRRVEGIIQMPTGITTLDEAKQASPIPHATAKSPFATETGVGRAFFDSTFGGKARPPFDLSAIYNAYMIDSYVYQSINKYVSLIQKPGWRLDAKNRRAVEYLKKRLSAMAHASSIPTPNLIRGVIEDLVIFGNAFLVKVRARTPNPVDKMKLTGFRGSRPIIALYPGPPQAMVAKLEGGKISEWQYIVNGIVKRKFEPSDIIHLKRNAPRGGIYGVPHLVPVLEDLRILRQIEANIVMLIYRNLHPLMHVRIGVPVQGANAAQIYSIGQQRIEQMSQTIQLMAPDSVLVTENDVEITSIGAESRALRAEPYLSHFMGRIYGGLGVSESIMGKGSSTTRSTAEQLAAEMHDTARDWQEFISDSLSWGVFFELLYEGGFDPLNDEDDFVKIEFAEVDVDMKIKKENHYTQLYVQNVISIDEVRDMCGLLKLSEKEEEGLYVNKVSIPTALSRAGYLTTDASTPDYERLPDFLPAPVAPFSKKPVKKSSPEADSFRQKVQKLISELRDTISDRVEYLYKKSDPEELSTFSSGELGLAPFLIVSESSISNLLGQLIVSSSRGGFLEKTYNLKKNVTVFPDFRAIGEKLSGRYTSEITRLFEELDHELYELFSSAPKKISEAQTEVSLLFEQLEDSFSTLFSLAWSSYSSYGMELARRISQAEDEGE
jgi:hypothetical protein